MTQEDKQLLLADLCARLPYGTICQMEDELIINDSQFYDHILSERHIELFRKHKGFYIKPYLRPMSSMTEDEKDEYSSFVLREHDGYLTNGMPDYTGNHYVYVDNVNIFIDWLNAHHLDYRGLIPKGLALEAHEGMYD